MRQMLKSSPFLCLAFWNLTESFYLQHEGMRGDRDTTRQRGRHGKISQARRREGEPSANKI